ncbi:PadR family transcriptional regulator [Methanosphaerula palustris]|uniref:Transcriptional regulator, PadR-like family n=1 Tax=Methanosphaerula palustris (strain ATCC BAA-1556 / DSM 19958 / E1-9c) TaxID=521011 RepID=B8GDI5_METPE|nr:PadR family transcriptional regulator [Methanosphaerula palustris]ACL17336.1 transcriptional regulator, PadR-like family [Methanosphaerula palustris E1-9c]
MNGKWPHHDERIHEMIWGFRDRMMMMENFGGLRSWILFALKDGPKNGVEIMNSIQDIRRIPHAFHDHQPGSPFPGRPTNEGEESGMWRPSPGSIYPMLNKMTNKNLILKMEDKRYEMTQTGQETFSRIFGSVSPGANPESRRYDVDNVLTEMNGSASYLGDIAKEKLIPQEAIIDEIIQKLTQVKESLHQQ